MAGRKDPGATERGGWGMTCGTDGRGKGERSGQRLPGQCTESINVPTDVPMKREYYSDSITTFLNTKPDEILGKLVRNNNFDLGQNQRDAWLEEISILHKVLSCHQGSIYFEYSIPRMGKRIDVVLLIGPVIFVLEFKIGEREFSVVCHRSSLGLCFRFKKLSRIKP